MKDPLFLEVSVKLVKTRYLAVCSAFPACKGYGKTRDAAIQSLSRSISSHISKIAKSSIEKLLTSDAYTEVVLDGSSKEDSKTLIYSLDPQNLSFQKQLSLKLDTVNVPGNVKKEASPSMQTLFGFQDDLNSINPNDPLTSSVGLLPPLPQQDGFTFGFSISLN